MSRARRFGQDTPFGKWFRDHPRLTTDPPACNKLSVQNLDYIWHGYETDQLMLIEEKQHGGGQTFAQADTHGIVSQMLAYGSGQPVNNERGEVRRVRYMGYHVLRFENTSPADGKMWLDERCISEEELVSFLRFEAPEDWYGAKP
jgi:hypothetical protein